jgi:hypothetical protein
MGRLEECASSRYLRWPGGPPVGQRKADEMTEKQAGQRAADTLFRKIVTDIHFWIPLLVLIAGLLLLHRLS